jgi:hypothetical protein
MLHRKLALVAGLAAAVVWTPLAADDAAARSVFSMICTREALALGHKDEALRSYIATCVAAKMKVYDDDMSNPLTAHLPKSC